MGVYAATKAAWRAFVRAWASELAGRRIRVNVVSAGPTDTQGVSELACVDNMADHTSALIGLVPVGRMARPEEVAAAVAFLASSDSSFMLGANLSVDAGVNQI